MSNETTLLPCPFCGGEAELVEGEYGMYLTGYAIYCKGTCGAKLGVTGRLCEAYEWTPYFDTEAEAIAAWNTRAYLNPDGLPAGLTISDDGNLLNWRGENYVKQAECDKWKAKAEEAGRAMNAAAGLWAKADAENRELRKMLLLDDGTIEEYTERADPLTALAYQKQLAEEWRDRCHNAEALCDKLEAERDELNATLGSVTCELYYGEDDDGYDGWYCDECGGWFQAVRRDGHLVEPKHCQECGRRRTDDR